MLSQTPLLSHKALPSGIPSVDWTNPLTQGLVGVYVPAAWKQSRIIYDLASVGADLTVVSAVYQSGKCTGLYANGATSPNGAFAAPSVAQSGVKAASVFWRGVGLATPGNTATFAGISQGNAAFTGNDGWGLITNGSLQLNAGCTIGASVFNGGSVFYSLNQEFSMGASFVPGGSMLTYVNGKLVDTTAISAGSFTYNAAPVSIGYEAHTDLTNRISFVDTFVEFLWNRGLSAQEHTDLVDDPYQFLLYPEDDLLAMISGSSNLGVPPPDMADRRERPVPVPY